MFRPPPGEVWIGEGDERQQRRIESRFAIASKEVTVDQFLRFRKEHFNTDDTKAGKPSAPTGDCPVNSVSWYDAAEYCNWLSAQEQLPREQWCYLPNKEGKYAEGMTLAPDYLKRTGYRLPTEAEWEYACRAGADTRYAYGESDDLLGSYAWFDVNSLSKSHPVGSLKSNDLGLFDMHGNLWEWSADNFRDAGWQKGHPDESVTNPALDTNVQNRVLRGGSWFNYSRSSRSANRLRSTPDLRGQLNGFRVVCLCGPRT